MDKSNVKRATLAEHGTIIYDYIDLRACTYSTENVKRVRRVL